MPMKNESSFILAAVVVLPPGGNATDDITATTAGWAGYSARPRPAAPAVAQPGGFWPDNSVPFSFVYDGKASDTFLDSWTHEAAKGLADRSKYSVSWTDPASGLKVTASATAFKDFAAVEWVLRFEKPGGDTPTWSRCRRWMPRWPPPRRRPWCSTRFTATTAASAVMCRWSAS